LSGRAVWANLARNRAFKGSIPTLAFQLLIANFRLPIEIENWHSEIGNSESKEDSSNKEIQMHAEELKERMKKFALDVACLCAYIPHVTETTNARGQLQRCSSSVAANYRAACRGKSKADFIAKLGTVEEEADESVFWLEFLHELNTLRKLQFSPTQCAELRRLQDEGSQLLAITISSRKTARSNS
jgi:four helix bundle protein